MSSTMEDFFGPPISVYTRSQAIADGTLIDVSAYARELGFRFPVAVTAGVWARTVAVPEELKGLQDEVGRLHDLLFLAFLAVRRASGDSNSRSFTVSVLQPRESWRTCTHEQVDLRIEVGPGDEAEPVLTILLPNED